jgi:O-antigen/teichoic acid export membrane protein
LTKSITSRINKNQGLANSVTDYIGIALGYVNTVLLMPYWLTTEQLGLARTLLDTGVLFSQFAQVGVPSIIIRFLPRFRDDQSRLKELMGFGLILAFLGVLVFAVLIWAFAGPIESFFSSGSPALAQNFNWVIVVGAGMVFFNVLDGMLKAYYKTTFAYFQKSVVIRLYWFLTLVAFWLEWINFDLFLMLYINGYAVILLITLVYALKQQVIHLSLPGRLLDRDFMKYVVKYTGFIFLGSSATVLTKKIDVLMIAGLQDLSNTGIYSVSFFIATAIMVPFRGSNRVFATQLSDAWNAGDLQRTGNIYQKVSKDQLVIAGFLFTAILGHYHNIFRILPSEYAPGGVVLIYLAFAKLFDSVTGVNGVLIMYSKYIKFFFAFNILLLVLTIGTNAYFIPRMGIEGAAIATAISVTLVNLGRLIFIYIKFGFLPLQFSDLRVAILIGAVLTIVLLALPQWENLYIDLIVRSLVICLLYLPLAYRLNVSKDFNKMIEGIFKFVPRNGKE